MRGGFALIPRRDGGGGQRQRGAECRRMYNVPGGGLVLRAGVRVPGINGEPRIAGPRGGDLRARAS